MMRSRAWATCARVAVLRPRDCARPPRLRLIGSRILGHTHTHTHTHTYRCVLESTYAFELGAELAEDARLQVCRGNRFVCSALALGDFDALRLRTLLNRSAASYMVPSLSPSCLLSHNTPYFLSCLIQDRAFPRSPVSFAVFAFSTLVGTTTGSRAKLEPRTWVRLEPST